MVVHDKSLSWYLDKIRSNEYFSQGLYGDGEWLCMLREITGRKVPIGTDCTEHLCDALEKSLYFKSDNYLFCSTEILKHVGWSGIGEKRIDDFLKQRDLSIEFYEREVWDLAMKSGELKEFIDELRNHDVVVVGNKYLRDLTFLNYKHFIEIGYPNCYTDGSLDRAYDAAIAY